MLDLNQIIDKLKDRNLAAVAAKIKVTRAYLSAIVRGDKKNPGYEIVKKLSDYLEQ